MSQVLYACMPMAANIGEAEAKSKGWTLKTCSCGKSCYETPMIRKAAQLDRKIIPVCTECAIRKGMQLQS